MECQVFVAFQREPGLLTLVSFSLSPLPDDEPFGNDIPFRLRPWIVVVMVFVRIYVALLFVAAALSPNWLVIPPTMNNEGRSAALLQACRRTTLRLSWRSNPKG